MYTPFAHVICIRNQKVTRKVTKDSQSPFKLSPPPPPNKLHYAGLGHPRRGGTSREGGYSTFFVRALQDQPKTVSPPRVRVSTIEGNILQNDHHQFVKSPPPPLSGQPYANMLWKRCSPVSIYLKSINSLTIVSILPVLRNWCLNLLFSCQ